MRRLLCSDAMFSITHEMMQFGDRIRVIFIKSIDKTWPNHTKESFYHFHFEAEKSHQSVFDPIFEANFLAGYLK